MWASTKALLYPRVKHYRKKQKRGAAEAEAKGLNSRQILDAGTPRSTDQDVILHVKGARVLHISSEKQASV